MPKIKRFIECITPVTACNLKCEYCYIIQENRRTNKIEELNYSPEHIAAALSQERLGGTCYISICGAGETLLPKYMTNLTEELLRSGHYVNITNNGTITERIKEICSINPELLKRLHFAFSFHYIELRNKGLIDTFFANVSRVKNAGCSFLVQINMYDGYIEHLEEIKRLCMENIGAYPQVAATRDESNWNLLTDLSVDEYRKTVESFRSPLFDFTMKNFMVKRKEFCYAGDWSFLLNLQTGVMSKCYANREESVNIFDDISKPINFEAIGTRCKNIFCVNSSHFMSLGVIPSVECPSYAQLRNREDAQWYTKEMKQFLSGKLYENNSKYLLLKQLKLNFKYYLKVLIRHKYQLNTKIYNILFSRRNKG